MSILIVVFPNTARKTHILHPARNTAESLKYDIVGLCGLVENRASIRSVSYEEATPSEIDEMDNMCTACAIHYDRIRREANSP